MSLVKSNLKKLGTRLGSQLQRSWRSASADMGTNLKKYTSAFIHQQLHWNLTHRRNMKFFECIALNNLSKVIGNQVVQINPTTQHTQNVDPKWKTRWASQTVWWDPWSQLGNDQMASFRTRNPRIRNPSTWSRTVTHRIFFWGSLVCKNLLTKNVSATNYGDGNKFRKSYIWCV